MEKSIKEKWNAVAAIKEPLSAEEREFMCWVVNERFAVSNGTIYDLFKWMGVLLAAIMHYQQMPREMAVIACDELRDMAKHVVKVMYDRDEAAEDSDAGEAAEDIEATTPQTDEQQ